MPKNKARHLDRDGSAACTPGLTLRLRESLDDVSCTNCLRAEVDKLERERDGLALDFNDNAILIAKLVEALEEIGCMWADVEHHCPTPERLRDAMQEYCTRCAALTSVREGE